MISESSLYFDVTDIAEYAVHHKTVTGIQRAGIRIIEAVMKHTMPSTVYGLIRIPGSGGFEVLDLSSGHSGMLATVLSQLGPGLRRDLYLARKLRKYRGKPFKKAYQSLRFRRKFARESAAAEDVNPSPPSFLGWASRFRIGQRS